MISEPLEFFFSTFQKASLLFGEVGVVLGFLREQLMDKSCSYLSAPGTGSPTIVSTSRGIIPA